ncbi:hypothetical protein AOLI_G00184120 [Acnodon oligacanthus]
MIGRFRASIAKTQHQPPDRTANLTGPTSTTQQSRRVAPAKGGDIHLRAPGRVTGAKASTRQGEAVLVETSSGPEVYAVMRSHALRNWTEKR